MGEAEAEGKLGGDSVHEAKQMCLAGLVRVLQMAVVEVLLETPLHLGHLVVFLIHHEGA